MQIVTDLPTTFTPRGGYVLLEEVDRPRGASGVYVPKTSEASKSFILRAMGEGDIASDGTRVPITGMSVGDEVLLHLAQYPTMVTRDDKGTHTYTLVPQETISAVVKGFWE